MRDQYAGDISDYLKFAFVRMVSRRPVPRHRFFTLVDGNAQDRWQVTEYVGRLNALPSAARVSAVCIGLAVGVCMRQPLLEARKRSPAYLPYPGMIAGFQHLEFRRGPVVLAGDGR